MNPTLNLPTPSVHVKTCNQAAAIVYPAISNVTPAFIEQQTGSLSQLPTIELLDLSDDFWAVTLENTVYLTNTRQFYQYQEATGIYEPVSEYNLINQILANLKKVAAIFPKNLQYKSYLELKNRTRLKAIIDRAKDLLCVNDSYFKQRPQYLDFANGYLNLNDNGFKPHCPEHQILSKLNVKYDPNAKCDLFLNAFLKDLLNSDDIDLLQRYFSMLLQGQNHPQKILLLTGDSGWGKSCLMRVMANLVGWERVGIVRDQLYRTATELNHYQGKHLLYHPDMPTEFLYHSQSPIFKQLVGGDPLWAENADGEPNIVMGTFPVVLACNGMPQIKVDQDSEAWIRRLVVINFTKRAQDHRIGKLAELISRENSGILNWLLEGRRKLGKDMLRLKMTQEQQERTKKLLMASESPKFFVHNCLVKRQDAIIGAAELYGKYQKWCADHQVRPFSASDFTSMSRTAIEIGLGLYCRHDLASPDGGIMRGWKGLAVLENEQTGSEKSEVRVQSEVLAA